MKGHNVLLLLKCSRFSFSADEWGGGGSGVSIIYQESGGLWIRIPESLRTKVVPPQIGPIST